MKELDKIKINEIAEKYGLNLLLLFGSQASGKANKLSDFDFGYISKDGMNYSEKGNLDAELSHLAEGEADAADLENAGSFLKYEIIRNNIILYQKDGIYENFFVQALREYFESKRLFEIRDSIIANKINELKMIYVK